MRQILIEPQILIKLPYRHPLSVVELAQTILDNVAYNIFVPIVHILQSSRLVLEWNNKLDQEQIFVRHLKAYETCTYYVIYIDKGVSYLMNGNDYMDNLVTNKDLRDRLLWIQGDLDLSPRKEDIKVVMY